MSGSAGPFFHGLRFVHAISLGANCETAHQLRRLGRLSLHGLFDWLVTPIDAIDPILADDGAQLARSFVSANNGTSVRCGAYGLLYHHEFPREPPGEAFRFDAELIAQCRRKLSHKFATLLGACAGSGPVVFIRTGPGSDLAWDARRAPVDADLRRLEASIERRFPELDFRLLVIDTSPEPQFTPPPPGDRLEVVHAPRRRVVGWALDDMDWDAIAARLRFATPADPAAQALNETLYGSGETQPGGASPEPPDHKARADLAFEHAIRLWRGGEAHAAAEVFSRLFADGYRADAFLDAYASLLTGERRFSDLLQRREDLVREGRPQRPRMEILAAHARLALGQDRDAAIRHAREREARSEWLAPHALMEALEAACVADRPFSFVRLGDGEARYALAAGLAQGPGLQLGDAAMLGDLVWSNWFGTRMSEADPRALARLARDYARAVVDADVLGVADAHRLASDTSHFGYLAAQETWLRHALKRGSSRRRFTSALNHYALDALSPHLSRLLAGRAFVAAVSPHPDLAHRLATALNIPQHADYPIPAEGRLPTAEATRLKGAHFPDRCQALLHQLRVPARGSVFVVAAGLLGKVYCHRIKALGGVAIDIGSVADGWMGFDTRPGQMGGVKRLPTQTKSTARRASEEPAFARPQIAACVSMAKTGSTALTHALRQAGWPDAVHTHYFGPRSLAFKQRSFDASGIVPEPMMMASRRLVERVNNAVSEVRIVTSIRDPIGRFVAQFFANRFRATSSVDIDLQEAKHDLIAWVERAFGGDRTTEWMDDNLGSTLGINFRLAPFDRDRGSCRLEANGTRVAIFRQEDEIARKELELGWLMDLPRLDLLPINIASAKPYHDAYERFKTKFVAPHSWINKFYETDAIQHFYSQAEVASFKKFWSAPH